MKQGGRTESEAAAMAKSENAQHCSSLWPWTVTAGEKGPTVTPRNK